MNYYETLLIIHPALEAGRLKDIILAIEENLKNKAATILSVDIWGKKRLAYLIEKQKYGTYVKLQFSGSGDCIQKLEMELQHNANILSYLTTTISKSDISEETSDLDTQIAGQSRESQTVIENEVQKTSKDASTEEKTEENVEEVENSKEEEKTEESVEEVENSKEEKKTEESVKE